MAEGFRIATAYVEVSPDTEGFRDKLQADLDAAVAGVHGDVGVGLDDSDLNAKLDDIRARIDDLAATEVSPKVGLNADEFDQRADDVHAELDDLDARHADPTVGLDLADFDLKVAEANAELDALEARTAKVKLGASGGGGGAGSGGGGGGSAFGEAGGGGEGMGFMGLLALGGAAALPGVAPAATGLGLLGATGFGALGGIISALSAHAQGVSQQAQNSAQNADMIQSAQMQLAQTYRNAAEAQVQATQGVTMAEQQLQQAEFGEQDAQINLTNARIQARLTLQALNDAQKDAVLGTQQAQLALAQAQYQQKLTDQNAMSTALDRQQAALSVAEAEQALTEAQQNQTNATSAANRVNKQGVNGQLSVIQAEQAVTMAVNGVKDARMQYADAMRNVTLTEQNNATQIAQAQLAVKEAQRQASASMNQFAYDMGKLTKPAQAVVNELLGMHGAVRGLEDIAQQTVLPGIVIFLNGVKSILPEVRTGMKLMGTAMGDSFGQFGKLMQTPAFKDGLAGLLRNSVSFINIVLPAFAGFLQMLGKVGGEKGAGTGLANLFAGLAGGLTGMVGALGRYIGPINQMFTAMGTILRALGPILGSMIGTIAKVLEPLARYLNSHPNGTVVKIIGEIAAGLIGWKVASKLVIGPMQAMWGTLSGGFGKLKSVWEKACQAYIKVFGEGGTVSRAGSWIAGLGGKIAGAFSSAWSGISTFGSNLGGWLVNAGQSVASFVGGLASQLGRAVAATGAWIAEHAVATASFIAENVMQAASATAAFIAENAATLGIVAGIAILVAAIVWLATHWHDVWGAIKAVALDVWHNVLDPMWLDIKKGAEWLYNVGIKPYFDLIKLEFTLLENAALWLWHNVLDPVWQGIMSGVRGFESTFSTVWSNIESIFKNPVNFLIGTVYDNGIRRFWNDIVSHIGLSSLELPNIAKLAGGGVIPGYAPGQDTVPAMLSPGEGVLTPGAVQAIGPGTVHSLNKQYGGSQGSQSGQSNGQGHAGKAASREGRRHSMRLGEHMLGFSGGGIFGDVGSFFTGLGHDLLSGAKFASEFALNPVGTVESILGKVVSTTAKGDLGKIMTGIPMALIKDLAGFISSFGSSGPGGKGGGLSTPITASGTVASWFTQALKLTGAPLSWLTDLETIGHYESGDNPNAINLTDSNAAAGDPSRGIMQTIMSTFLAYHQAGTSMNIYNPIANIAAAIRYIRARYGTPGNTPGIISLAHGGGYQGYDSGGWLMPGGMPINQTGRPEAVLTPEESDAFVELVKRFTGGGPDGGAGLAGGVNFNYFGTQYPTVEQRMLQRRDLAMALGGAGG